MSMISTGSGRFRDRMKC